MASNSEPTEKRFHEDKKDKWGEGIALDGATANVDRVGHKSRWAVDDDAGIGIAVYAADDVNRVSWESQVVHYTV
jgi:hypothetical protein